MDKALELLSAITGTVFILVALYYLAPQGMYLYLGMLIVGVQLVGMAFRSAFKSRNRYDL
jgi:hypothetical protein|tara:strand:- start:202 stop:381 length:180 start_codon:yes stop_codon:yes gene_type:complete